MLGAGCGGQGVTGVGLMEMKWWQGMGDGWVMLCESSWALVHVPRDRNSALERRKKHLRKRWR